MTDDASKQPNPVWPPGHLVPVAGTLGGPIGLQMPGIKITFDPPHVEVTDPAVSWSGAAKMFWNEVARAVGQRPPFGW